MAASHHDATLNGGTPSYTTPVDSTVRSRAAVDDRLARSYVSCNA